MTGDDLIKRHSARTDPLGTLNLNYDFVTAAVKRKEFFSDVGLSSIDSAIRYALPVDAIMKDIMPIATSGDPEAIRRKIDQMMSGLDPLHRHLVLGELGDVVKKREQELLAEKGLNARERAELRLASDILGEMIKWEEASDCRILQVAVSSRAHELTRAFRENLVFGVCFLQRDDLKNGGPPLVNYEDDGKVGEVFVVEHDWAAAFANAGDYEGKEFRLPYDHCTFEFCFGGRRMIVRAKQAPEQAQPDVQAFVELRTSRKGGWLCLTAPTDKLYDMVGPALLQIKAICVSLEADITYTDAVRIPDKLRKARERDGKLPPLDHHVVRLNHRPRAARYEGEHEPGPRKRLHFRRGHWRHYATHRTWIKWTLVGNPDLGFVDKEYRL